MKDPTDNELSHSMVHYLLTIHKLKENRGFARVTDIAKDLEHRKMLQLEDFDYSPEQLVRK